MNTKKLFNKLGCPGYFRKSFPPQINVLICLALVQKADKAIRKMRISCWDFCFFFFNIGRKNKMSYLNILPCLFLKKKKSQIPVKMQINNSIIESSKEKKKKEKKLFPVSLQWKPLENFPIKQKQ